MAHDTIYKRPELEGFGGALMRGIEERMENIMRRFLLPAGYEFQKVQADFERLSTGKELFDRGAFQGLADCEDNNARFDLLERFQSYVLPNYDDIGGIYTDLRSTLITAVKRGRETDTKTIDTPFGTLPGKTGEDVSKLVADILERVRYVDVEGTFNALCELYPDAQSDEERARWLTLAEHLAHHELRVWRQAGAIVQSLLVARVKALPDDSVALLRPVIIRILGQVVETEISGTSSTYDAITLHRGVVAASDLLINARSGAIEVLEALFRTSKDDSERRAVINAFSAAKRVPHGARDERLTATILRDATRIVSFYSETAPTLTYEILQTIEHNLLWLFRYNCNARDPHEAEDVANCRVELSRSIFAFRDAVNRNHEFVVYKTLVGFESVFRPAWEDENFALKIEDDYREQCTDEFVQQVTEESAEEWFRTLQRCARTESTDLATFPTFGRFLEKLSEAKPTIALGYVGRLEEPLSRFLPSIMGGLERSEHRKDVRRLILAWIEERKFLPEIIRHLQFTTDFEICLLKQTLDAAIQSGQTAAVLMAIRTAAARYGEVDEVLEEVFLPALGYLAPQNDFRWIDLMWPARTSESMFRNLTPHQADTLLAVLVPLTEINYRTEELLTAIAECHPTKVVDFFGLRLASKKGGEFARRYEAIPFEFHKLQKPLSVDPDYLIEKARYWFEQDQSLFAYRGGRLLSIVFPTFSPEFEAGLLTAVRSGNRLDLEFVTALLRAYEGQTFLHDLCKEIVNALTPDDPLLSEIETALEATGVLSGEFGGVVALVEKKAQVDSWLGDNRQMVRDFAERYRRQLDNQIASEQRRSEELLELRKREYGERENDVEKSEHDDERDDNESREEDE